MAGTNGDGSVDDDDDDDDDEDKATGVDLSGWYLSSAR